jgi:hypothetical protein
MRVLYLLNVCHPHKLSADSGFTLTGPLAPARARLGPGVSALAARASSAPGRPV